MEDKKFSVKLLKSDFYMLSKFVLDMVVNVVCSERDTNDIETSFLHELRFF